MREMSVEAAQRRSSVVGSALINEVQEGRDPVALVRRLLAACRD